MNLFIIDFAVVAPHLETGRRYHGKRNMKTIHKVAIASTIAFSALAFVAITGAPAQAGPITPPGHYCLAYALGGTDCGFTSYAQCQATASGLAAECYGNTVRDDEESQSRSQFGYGSRAQGY
jgi:hypothetical protein